MGHIYFTINSVLRGLRRKCPKCKTVQAVPAAKKHEQVPCKKCGEPIPPRGRESQRHD